MNQKKELQSSKSYIKDNEDLIRKIKDIQYIPSNGILVTAGMIGLYPSIPNDFGLKSLKIILDKIMRSNYFDFNGKVRQLISGTTIGTNCAPTYFCIYMDEFENEFLSLRSSKPLVWFRYIDDIFFRGHSKVRSLG